MPRNIEIGFFLSVLELNHHIRDSHHVGGLELQRIVLEIRVGGAGDHVGDHVDQVVRGGVVGYLGTRIDAFVLDQGNLGLLEGGLGELGGRLGLEEVQGGLIVVAVSDGAGAQGHVDGILAGLVHVAIVHGLGGFLAHGDLEPIDLHVDQLVLPGRLHIGFGPDRVGHETFEVALVLPGGPGKAVGAGGELRPDAGTLGNLVVDIEHVALYLGILAAEVGEGIRNAYHRAVHYRFSVGRIVFGPAAGSLPLLQIGGDHFAAMIDRHGRRAHIATLMGHKILGRGLGEDQAAKRREDKKKRDEFTVHTYSSFNIRA
ncbi:hypothetical protein TRIP_E170017 [uncultured Spirochaetota bacterium]|nr:hypothetical protein TRIP_E170017 [uncultured Spirochaetota bacterium]